MRDRDFGMCLHWSNLRHFDQSKMRIAQEHHCLHNIRNLFETISLIIETYCGCVGRSVIIF